MAKDAANFAYQTKLAWENPDADRQPQWNDGRFEYHRDAQGVVWQRRLYASLWWRIV
jgi:hypothetical protein